MTKRVYEYAKEHNMTSKELITVAEKSGIEFGSHMSSMSEDQETKLSNIISKGKSNLVKQEDSSAPKAEKATTNNAEATKPAQKDTKETANTSSQNKPNQTTGTNQPNQTKKEDKNTNTKQSNTPNRNAGNQNRSNQSGGRRNNRNRKGKNKNFRATESKGITQRKHKDLPEKLVYNEGTNIQEIAKMLHRDASEIIKKLMMNGVMANQNQALSKEVIELIALDYGIEPEEKVVVNVSDLEVYFEEEQDETVLETRPAVVTIMGHVDHGKTTLLDQLRHSRVTEGEAGGITQHIGAYQVETEDKQIITFLDTPGHEAFTTMRARGADVTDIAIIVVAADDGVMPQTVEAINHAKAADVPIIIAVNKIDKPEANPDRVKQELSEHGIISEDWGGENIFVEISAKFNQNLDELLEMVVLVSEIQELKANPNRLALGTVIEARLDKSQGPTATLLVQDGTLNIGDPIVVGNTYGRVRTMVNDIGRRIKSAGPATPVEITGLQNAPHAGDLFVVFEDEKTARQAGEQRAQEAQEVQRGLTKKVTLENLFESLQEGELKSVNIIIKGDVQGSVEALSASLQKIEVEGVRVNSVHQAVGAINESDISLAAASGAVVIGFNVRPTPQARVQADAEEVEIRQYRVIYDAIDDVETAMKGMLDPEYVEEIQGQALVRETYTVSKLGTIAGAFVTDGYIARNSQIRLIRDNIVIFEGALASLKRFKDDAKQVAKGYECGLMIENYNDVKMDDVIEAFHMVEVAR